MSAKREESFGLEQLRACGAVRVGRPRSQYEAAFGQEHVLTPIAETLKQFRPIRSVDYAINGKVIEEWDA